MGKHSYFVTIAFKQALEPIKRVNWLENLKICLELSNREINAFKLFNTFYFNYIKFILQRISGILFEYNRVISDFLLLIDGIVV